MTKCVMSNTGECKLTVSCVTPCIEAAHQQASIYEGKSSKQIEQAEIETAIETLQETYGVTLLGSEENIKKLILDWLFLNSLLTAPPLPPTVNESAVY